MNWYARNEIPRRGWRRLRRRVLQRDGYRCRICGKGGRLEVDHIKPVSRGGERMTLENLQAVCRGDHILKTSAENRRPLTPAGLRWASLVNDLVER